MMFRQTNKTTGGPQTVRTLEMIRQLLSGLDRESIRYCQWKSNYRLRDWLAGDGDLDLLVDRRDAESFFALLAETGFKKFTAGSTEMPGILNFYGLDRDSGKFVHVHAHLQLTLGHDLTKNYRLPVESMLLAGAARLDGIFVPAPEAELLLFIIRMTLKFSVAESAARTAKGSARALRDEIARELDFLESTANEAKLSCLRRRHFPLISAELFADCTRLLREPGRPFAKVAARLRLESALADHALSGRIAESSVRFVRRVKSVASRIVGIRARKRPEAGGSLIAIVGGDGAGKTTCVSKSEKWLGKRFAVRRFHLGKPPKSMLTLWAGGMLKMHGMMPRPMADFFGQLRRICTARDRVRLYRRMRRAASNGEIVLCDRYPVAGIRLMDAPRLWQETIRSRGWRFFMSRAECWYYRRLQSADHMIVLRVDPVTAAIRKTDEAPSHVISRAKELWEFDWSNERAEVIDAGRPLDEVLSDVRQAIWEKL